MDSYELKNILEPGPDSCEYLHRSSSVDIDLFACLGSGGDPKRDFTDFLV